MATITAAPARRGISRRWLVGGVLLIAAAIAVAIFLSNGPRPAAGVLPPTVPVARGAIVETVVGSGAVAAEQQLELPFQSAGRVSEVLVKEGQVVEAGEVLARLDDRDLQLQVANAEVSLTSAQARLAQSQDGNATPQDMTSAEASVANAEAGVRAAQAKLDDLRTGPSPESISAAQAQLAQAQATLSQLQDGPSAADETAAKVDLANAEATLQRAQAAYDIVSYLPDISARPEAVELQQATNNYEAAKARHDNLFLPPNAAELASAQSQVRNAEAQLRAAREGASQADIAQAQAGVEQAQASLTQARASLEKLTAPASPTDVSIQEASVAQAEQALEQAKLSLEYATLRAPFAGVVTAVSIVPGSIVNASGPVITLVDRSMLHVDLKLSENDVARAELGQPVTLTIDALSDWSSAGEVTYIAPVAETTNDVVTYKVQVRFDEEERVRVGMTANLSILTNQAEGILLVPNSALLPKGTGRVVVIPNGDGTTREVEVETGLTDGSYTQIVSGVEEGTQILAVPTDASIRPRNPFGPP